MLTYINNQANNYKINHIISVQTHQIGKKRKKKKSNKTKYGKKIVQRRL